MMNCSVKLFALTWEIGSPEAQGGIDLSTTSASYSPERLPVLQSALEMVLAPLDSIVGRGE